MRYLTGVHEGLIEDLGGIESLSTQKLILIDRLVSLLGVIRSVEEHFKEDIMTPSGDLKPALSKSYLAYNNTLRLTLMALGLERQNDTELTVMDTIKAFDAKTDKANSEAETQDNE